MGDISVQVCDVKYNYVCVGIIFFFLCFGVLWIDFIYNIAFYLV